MNDKDKVQLQTLIQVLIRLRAEYRVLREALAQHDEELLLQQWGRHWEREQQWQRLKDARN